MESSSLCRTGRRGACLMKTFDNGTLPSYLKVSLRHRIGKAINVCCVAACSMFCGCRRRLHPCRRKRCIFRLWPEENRHPGKKGAG
ncbi:MAG: hypothetical protein A4E70_02218 [Syntrophus sp. PtaU1.Bin005]|nr:MAG: hypothetical protein A4E69_03331 [Syntrophus sp. PtaB.Bin138]OPY79197.1 MAG: hypothetical protein A4E70_02218 [Syntrophus sp. PtaU1.Bin005]